MADGFEFSGSRRFVFAGAIILMFVVFLARLVQLQILYQDEYGKRSEENSIRPITIDPIRGYLFDRHGALVVDNRPSYTVTITPAEFSTRNIPYLSEILRVDSQFIHTRIRKGIQYNRFAPVKIKRDIDFATLALLEEYRSKLPGVDYQIETKRYYPTKAKAPHLFGYTKEVSERLLAENPTEYRPGDVIGATGIEAAYEKELHGQKGFQFITVNARGQMVGSYNEGKGDIPVKEGNDLYLSLDAGVQALAESLMADREGAVVAIDPRDGGVIALVSKPDYDPEALSGFTSSAVWQALNTDPSKPLFNRATLTRYPPGSTYKMVSSVAALQDRVIPPGYTINCRGAFQFGTRAFKDLHVHGSTDMVESIQKSCNVYYYQLVLKIGFDRWTRYGAEFGFGTPTGIDIIEEDKGLLPSPAVFDRMYGKGRWTQGYLVSLGIGQGELGVSPLQMASYAMTLGNEGKYFRPHVVKATRNKESGKLTEVPLEVRELSVRQNVFAQVKEGMYRCVNTPGGTGGMARVEGGDVCGKTGTAQNPHGKDHAWFIGFAPRDNPTIAICVLVENAGFGGAIAAPIAGLCIEQYLRGGIVRFNPRDALSAGQAMTDFAD